MIPINYAALARGGKDAENEMKQIRICMWIMGVGTVLASLVGLAMIAAVAFAMMRI